MKTIPTKLLHTKFEPEPTKTVVGPPKSLFRSQNLQLNPLTSEQPTVHPSQQPTVDPTDAPTGQPTDATTKPSSTRDV